MIPVPDVRDGARRRKDDGTVRFILVIPEHTAVASLDVLVSSESLNAIIGWTSSGILALVLGYTVLSNALLWAGFSCAVLVVILLPPWSTGRWSVMAPWPLSLISAIAVLTGGFGVFPEIAGYFAVAALALLTAIELDAFTSVKMSRRFAVVFAVLTTLAVQSLWIIAQYYSDLWLGTDYLSSQVELQVDIVLVTLVGLAMGAVFEWYFARVEHVGSYKRPNTSSPQ